MDDADEDTLLFLTAIIKVIAFYANQVNPRNVISKPGVRQNQVKLLAAFTRNSQAVAEASVPLWTEPYLEVAARPLARVLFETGLYAQWVWQEPEAANAVLAAHKKQRQSLANDAATIPLFAGLKEEIEETLPDVYSPLAGIAKSVEQVCLRFEEGKTLYFLYRLLCGNTHAGIQIAEQWLEADARLSFHVRETPHPQNATMLATALMGLLLCATAFEEQLEPGRVDVIRFLREISDQVGLPGSLSLKTKPEHSGRAMKAGHRPNRTP